MPQSMLKYTSVKGKAPEIHADSPLAEPFASVLNQKFIFSRSDQQCHMQVKCSRR